MELDFEAWALQDEGLPDGGALTEQELFEEIMKPEEEEDDEEEEEEEEDVELLSEVITYSQAISHCEELRRYLTAHKEEHMFIREVESQVKRSRRVENRQLSIDSFLTPSRKGNEPRQDTPPSSSLPRPRRPLTPKTPVNQTGAKNRRRSLIKDTPFRKRNREEDLDKEEESWLANRVMSTPKKQKRPLSYFTILGQDGEPMEIPIYSQQDTDEEKEEETVYQTAPSEPFVESPSKIIAYGEENNETVKSLSKTLENMEVKEDVQQCFA